MRILLVEDDHNQEEAICDAIQDEFPDLEIEVIRSELAFRMCLDSIAQTPPSLIIMDGMMRWTDPSPDMVPPPQDVKDGGPFHAGMRCHKLITAKSLRIPVLFHTILDREDLADNGLPQEICHLPKKENPNNLTDKIRRLLNRRRS